MKKTVSLVLGSGAARGFAHLGVIKAIEDEGFEVVSVSGCSIGSVVGGVYAAGKIDDFSNWACSLDKVRVLRMMDMSFRNGAYIKGERFFRAIEDIIERPSIESLPMPYTAVAVDILNQKEFWFQKGDLIDAMRASSAIPSIVSPLELNGRFYVDGGVLNPLPIIPTVAVGADYIIAVDLNGSSQGLTPKDLKEESEESTEAEWWNLKGLFSRQKSDKEPKKLQQQKKNNINWGRIQTVNMMFETMQESISQFKLAGYAPDLLISIPKDFTGFYEFWRAQELIEFGYDVAVKSLTELKSSDTMYYSFPKGD